MLAGMAGALAEQGYARATVSDVLERAKVSRRTFYEQFTDKDECLYAAYDDAERRAWEAAAAAVAEVPALASTGDPSADPWPRKVHAALTAALEFAAAEPDTARLFTLAARAAGPEMAARHAAALDRVATLLRSGNQRAARAERSATGRPGGAGPADVIPLPEATERTLVANVAALVGSYVISGATELLPGLEPQLAEHLLSPYREAAG
jgi:AcrR family transcriptional regulator